MARTSASARMMTDHDEIRNWAEERNAKPTCVKGTGSREDTGMIRLDFPGYTGADSLQPISWDDWFDKFDEKNLGLLVQDETSRGETSNFNKLVNREVQSARRGSRSSCGETRGHTVHGEGSRSTSKTRSSRAHSEASTRSNSRTSSKTSTRGRSTDRSGTGRQGSSSRTEQAKRSGSQSKGSRTSTSGKQSARGTPRSGSSRRRAA